MADDRASQGSFTSISTAVSQQTTKAGLRRFKKRVCNRFWEYVDDFEEFRCLSRADNVWMVRCKTCRGLISLQSFPKASPDVRLRLYKMVLIFEELAEQIPFVLRVHDIVEDKGAVLICSEFCPRGTLCDALNQFGSISNTGWLVCEAFVPLMIVLHHMHASGAVHRNVTPSSIWFQVDGSARIGGLEFSSQLTDVVYSEIVGSLEFVAPEMLLCSASQPSPDAPGAARPSTSGMEQLSYSYSVDVWSLGITVFLSLTGELPFNGGPEDDADILFQNILLSEPEYPSDMDEDAADFVRACLAKEPSDRPAMRELLAHKYVQKHLQWERAPNERTPDSFYEPPPEEVQAPDTSFKGKLRSMFARSSLNFPRGIVFPDAAPAALQEPPPPPPSRRGSAALFDEGRTSYISYQPRPSASSIAGSRGGSQWGQEFPSREPMHGGAPKWKHFPASAQSAGAGHRVSTELLQEAEKSRKYDNTISGAVPTAGSITPGAGAVPFSPSDRIHAWECGTPAGSAAQPDCSRQAELAGHDDGPSGPRDQGARQQPPSLLCGDAVINLDTGNSAPEAAGEATAQVRSPRAMAADLRWSVKWVNSWTGDTSPRSPIASPRNPPAAATSPRAEASGSLMVVQEISEEAEQAERVGTPVVGVGRRGLVEVGDADDGTVMWSRSVPRTPASRASDGHHSSVAAPAASSVAGDEDMDMDDLNSKDVRLTDEQG